MLSADDGHDDYGNADDDDVRRHDHDVHHARQGQGLRSVAKKAGGSPAFLIHRTDAGCSANHLDIGHDEIEDRFG